MRVVGMISGTSYDGIDAAAADLELDGDVVTLRPLGLSSCGWPEELRARIAAVLPPNPTTIDEVCRLDTELGQLFGEAAVAGCLGPAEGRAELVVSHGQTVFHWVEGDQPLGTLQLGAPAWIAAATGLPVVSDLRGRDITRGGHGAPLASTLDALLLADRPGPSGALNLGGIANITVLAGSGLAGPGLAGSTAAGPDPIAYDIGPANALIDAAVVAASSGAERLDRDGVRAGRGRVDPQLLEVLLAEPYYARPAPKSTGKELFHSGYVDELRQRAGLDSVEVSSEDLIATLTELSAVLVARSCARHRLRELVVSGGGVHNPVLMDRISALAAPTTITSIDAFGLPAQAKEAYLFALLGFLTVHGLVGTFASATGASEPSVLGSITPGNGPLWLPEPAPHPPRRLRIVS